MLIFEKSRKGCFAHHQAPKEQLNTTSMLSSHARKSDLTMPEVSELEVIRHYTRLSKLNFSIDTNFYPLGSCTMKYNPRGAHKLASLPGFTGRHPHAHYEKSQGFLSCMYELQDILKDVTGMKTVSLAPMAGAQGEFAGVAMIKAYHEARGDHERCEIIIPDAAHGTNPASAVMCGYKVKQIETGKDGDIDLDNLKAALGPQTAGIMLTNPSTLGVFERKIKEIARLVHEAGGLLYYDGANLNAILGKVRPGDMGFDVMHMNLHKTFATPHGGGGPGAGPVAAGERLAQYLPIPMVGKSKEGKYYWKTKKDCPDTMGRLTSFAGNAGILLRAYIYARMLGQEGMHRVSENATLGANYMMARLEEAGFKIAYPSRRATHEFLITLEPEHKNYHVSALDFAKALLDYGVHAPTMYFPLLVPECFLIEPTETESKAEMDAFVDAMIAIREKCKTDPEAVKAAPVTMPVKRLDDVKAARELDLKYTE